MSDVTVQDLFLRFYEDFRMLYPVSSQQARTALCIMKCKTPEMGANVSVYPECHFHKILYNSCRNRFCTMCQAMDVDKWIDIQQEDVLDVPYFHAVFTIPEELYALTYSNQQFLYTWGSKKNYHPHILQSFLAADWMTGTSGRIKGQTFSSLPKRNLVQSVKIGLQA